MTNYQIAKSTLKTISLDAKNEHRNDKPMIRMIINDSVDSISRDLRLDVYDSNRLSDYACTLHPKD